MPNNHEESPRPSPEPPNPSPAAPFDRFANDYDGLLRDPLRDRFAAHAGFFFERKWRLLQDFYARHHRRTKDAAWLDVGCGRGELLRLGAGDFRAAAGCDPSAGMLEHCHPLNVRLQPDPARIPFENGSFDLLTAVCVFHHVPPPARPALLAEFRRVLRPGALVCLFEHNPWNPVTRRIVRRTPVDAGASLLTAALGRRLLRAAGFAILETSYFLYFPEKLYSRLAFIEDRLLRRMPLGGQYAVFGQNSQRVL